MVRSETGTAGVMFTLDTESGFRDVVFITGAYGLGETVVQGAVKNLLEPIFEATFWHVSYGFRPRRGCHGALEHIRMTMRPRAKAGDGRRHRTPYRWVIEGDIKLDLNSEGPILAVSRA